MARILLETLRVQPNLLTALLLLTARVKEPDINDWKKLQQLVTYTSTTVDLKLHLSVDDVSIIKWWVDTSFATRKDVISQPGAYMSTGRGSVYSASKMQQLNTKISTESELVRVYDVMPQIISTRKFLISQGYGMKHNIVYQDNKSAVLLKKNGLGSFSKHTRHINCHFFFVVDQIKNEAPEGYGNIDEQLCWIPLSLHHKYYWETTQTTTTIFLYPLQYNANVQRLLVFHSAHETKASVPPNNTPQR